MAPWSGNRSLLVSQQSQMKENIMSKTVAVFSSALPALPVRRTDCIASRARNAPAGLHRRVLSD